MPPKTQPRLQGIEPFIAAGCVVGAVALAAVLLYDIIGFFFR